MKKYLFFCLIFLAFACEKEDDSLIQVNRIEPHTGVPGSRVRIWGNNIYDPGLTVYFGDKKAEIKDMVDGELNLIKVIVPDGLDNTLVKIKLQVSGTEVEAPDQFIVPDLPKIDSLSSKLLTVRDSTFSVYGKNFNSFGENLWLNYNNSFDYGNGEANLRIKEVIPFTDNEIKVKYQANSPGSFFASVTGEYTVVEEPYSFSTNYETNVLSDLYIHSTYKFLANEVSAGGELGIAYYRNNSSANIVKVGQQEVELKWTWPLTNGFEAGYVIPESLQPGVYEVTITEPNGKAVACETENLIKIN